MRKILFIIISIVVSIFFLFLALNGIPVEQIVISLQQANLVHIFIALIMATIALITRGIRWRGLLQNRISHIESFYMLCIAMLLNQLPMRAGEAARSILVTRSGVPLLTAATSVLVERLLDMLSVVITLSLTLTQVPNVPPTIAQTAILFGFAGLLGVGVLLFFARYPQVARNLLGFFERLIPLIQKLPLHKFMENILDGIKPLAQLRTAIHAIGWTIISWVFSFLTGYFTVLAVGIVDNAWLMTFLSITLASLAIAIPVSMASIGPFESAVIVAGQALNISRVTAGALGFLLHGIFVLSYAIWGTLGLIVLGVSFTDITKSSDRSDSEETSKSMPTIANNSLSAK